MQGQLKELKKELHRDFPRSDPVLTLFPSGAASLNVKIGSETYVLAYHLDVGLGINRMSAATFGWEGYEHPVETVEEARSFLISRLKQCP